MSDKQGGKISPPVIESKMSNRQQKAPQQQGAQSSPTTTSSASKAEDLTSILIPSEASSPSLSNSTSVSPTLSAQRPKPRLKSMTADNSSSLTRSSIDVHDNDDQEKRGATMPLLSHPPPPPALPRPSQAPNTPDDKTRLHLQTSTPQSFQSILYCFLS